MLKKSAIVALALLAFGIARLAERTPLSELENLRQLDNVDDSAPVLVLKTRDAFQSVNENALGYLPVMPVLHAQDAIAGVALSLGGTSEPVVARHDEGFSPAALVRGAATAFSPFGFIGAVALQ